METPLILANSHDSLLLGSLHQIRCLLFPIQLLGGKFIVLIVTIMAIISIGCSSKTTLVYVIPDGYVGKLTIYQDNDGKPLEELGSNKLKVVYESDGTLKSQEYFNIAESWHATEAHYQNGTQIPTVNNDTVFGDGVYFFSMGGGTMSRADGVDVRISRAFVGTTRDYKALTGFEPQRPKDWR